MSGTEKTRRTQDKKPKQSNITRAEFLKMTSGWFLPREDSPSVVSNRVFTIRRLNKMESQRLGTRLDGLSAEVEQARSLISREQKELRKQLTQIQEVKGNPPVSAERRKLSQELSCKEASRHGSSSETPGVQQRYRSLSTGDRYRGAPLTQLPLVNGRSRSQSSSTPVRLPKDDPSRVFRKLSGGSNGTNCNSHSEAWPGISTFVKCNDKPRQRSRSTGTYPRFSAWETIAKNNAVTTGLKRDDMGASSRIESEKSGVNRTWRQDHLDLDLTQSQTWAWKETRRFIRNKSGATVSSKDKGNSRQQKGDEVTISGQNSELASTRKERRQRSFSTNSAPTISRGRVVEVHKEEPSKANKISSDQHVNPSSSRQRRYNTYCRPNLVNGEVVDVPGDKENTSRISNRQGVAVQLIRRQRSLSTNCPPVILENETVIESDNNINPFNPLTSVDDDKQRNGSRSESEEQNTFSKYAMSEVDIPCIGCQDISTVGRKNKTEQVHDNELSLPRL